MSRRRTRFMPGLSLACETLETRLVLTAGVAQGAVTHVAHAVATQTTLEVNAGTLGQPVTFNVTVRGPASAGSPAGTVEIVDHGSVLGTATVAPMTSSTGGGKYAYGQATYTFTPQPGGPAYYFGKHPITAEFIPIGLSSPSTAKGTFSVYQPTYTTLADGVKVATVSPGSGPAIQSGQTANVLYTGYLAKNGKIFDDSVAHGATPFTFTLGAGQVIPGFDAGTVGMQPGETRIIEIPSSQGYGSTASGSIPANSTLIFVMTLQSIS